MWFRNLVVYRLPAHWDMNATTLDELLAPERFRPAAGIEEMSLGWVPPREVHERLAHPVGKHLLLVLRQEKKLLPAKVITQFVRERALQIEAEEGFKPGRKRMKELKEEVRDQLLPRAFSLASDTRLWIDPVAGWLCVDAASASRAETAFGLLVKCVQGLPARGLRVTASVPGEMTAWLSSGEAPSGFSIDQDVEMKARDSKASVRYANQSLEAEDVARHVKAGKQCTKLALTWSDRISFVLTDRLELRRIKPLDVVKDEAAGASDGDAEERFDGDMTLMCGELSKLLADVVDTFGGEPVAQAA